jgi:rubredoxin
MNYICALCGYVYRSENGDPENGVAPRTDFEDVSEDWVCPLCGASKEDFEPYTDEVEEL